MFNINYVKILGIVMMVLGLILLGTDIDNPGMNYSIGALLFFLSIGCLTIAACVTSEKKKKQAAANSASSQPAKSVHVQNPQPAQPQNAAATPKFCSSCGSKLNAGDVFCSVCGSKIQ